MKKHLKKILSFGLALSITLGLIVTPTATDVEVTVTSNPKIDIMLTSKDTNLDLSNFETDIKAKLKQMGINTDDINFQTVKRGVVSTNKTDASKVFNGWSKLGVKGNWSLTTYNGVNVIYNAENTDGTTGYYSPDSFKLTDMTLEYDFMSTDTDDDFVGVILRLNIDEDKTNTSKPLDTKITGYWFWEAHQGNVNGVWKEVGGLYKMNAAMLPCDLTSYGGKITYIDGVSSVFNTSNTWVTQSGIKQLVSANGLGWTTKNTWIHYKFEIKGNTFTAYRDGVKIAEYTDNSGQPITSGTYGLINMSQPSRYKNFVATYTYHKTFKEVLTEPTWREDAKHVIINVDNSMDDTLISKDTIGEVLSRTLADDIHFVQWGTDVNKSATTNFIKQNDNKGLFIYNNNYNQAVIDTVEYISSLVEQQESEEQYITIGQELNLLVTPEGFEKNAVSDEYPNGRWKINHDYKHFKNNLGQSTDAGVYTPNLNCNFDKPGKYTILFDDKPVKTIYVHRKPVADFEISINNLIVDLNSVSYDLDSNINNGYGVGIASEIWYYKEVSETIWHKGKLDKLNNENIYVIKLEVTDNEGVTNYTTKYIGTGNPVAKFNFTNDIVCKFNKLEINNTSYDPEGRNIKSESWILKKDGEVIGTYTTPILDFNTITLGAGNYSYTLTVTNSADTVSEAYTKSFTIVDDIAKPEITIETEVSNEWLTEKEVDIEINDNESYIAKWRYEFVTSPTPTIEDDEWSNWETEKTEMTINSGTLSGRYYLHIQAYDEANNLTERTIGPFNLDNTNPVINGVDVEKQGFRDNKVTIHAFDEHSGIVGYALTKYEPTTFSVRTFTAVETPEFQESNEFKVESDGLYTAWAIDALGNIETSVCEVTNSNQTDKTTTVYAEIRSEFKVTIPKEIVLDGTTKSGTYQVTVEGDIAGLEIINVTPDSAVTLSSKDKADVIGTITQDKLNWTYNEMYANSKILANGSISAQGITAGTWNGTFNFAIKLENNGKYTNSEWYVEYQDITFDMEELDNFEVTKPTE